MRLRIPGLRKAIEEPRTSLRPSECMACMVAAPGHVLELAKHIVAIEGVAAAFLYFNEKMEGAHDDHF